MRARQEPAVAPEPDDHRVALGADLVGRLGREVGPLELATLLVDAVAQRPVEGAQQRDPGALAAGDLVELLLHPCGELDIDVVAEVLDEQVGDDLGHQLGVEPSLLDADVAAIDDRRDRGRVRRRPADAVLLERLDERRLGEARRRLGEVLVRGDLDDARPVALDQGGQLRPLVLVVGGLVVATLGVDAGEAVEQDLGRARPQLVRSIGQVDRGGLELLGRHLRGERPLPDQPVQAQLLGREVVGERVRVPAEARRADRLVGLLGALALGLVDAALGHRVGRAVAIGDDLARLAHGHAGHRGRVRAHVGDEPDLSLARVDALVQVLRDRHRPLRAEAQATARLLLEGGGRERRRRRALLGPDAHLRDDRMRLGDGLDVTGRGLDVADIERLAVDAHELGREPLAARRLEDRLDRPVLACDEARDLALALDDQADGHGLDTAGREAAADLARQERAQHVADEAVDDAPGLLGVDEVLVDLAGMGERLADRRLGDLAERDPVRLLGGHVRRLGHVPGDGLALAIEVGGEEDGVGPLGGLLDVGDLLAAIVADDVLGREVVVDVDAELALAGILGQVADVAVGGEHAIVGAQIAFDRPRLGGRFDDHEVLWHGRECSTGSCTDPHPGREPGPAGEPWSGPLDLADAAQEVLVDLEVLLGRQRGGIHAATQARADRDGLVAVLGERRRRDLDEPDVLVREEEDRVLVVDEDRSLAVERAQVRAAQTQVHGGRHVEQVGQKRLLAVDVDAGVVDHGTIFSAHRARCQPDEGVGPDPTMVRSSTGGRSRRRGGPDRARPRRRCRRGRTSCS